MVFDSDAGAALSSVSSLHGSRQVWALTRSPAWVTADVALGQAPVGTKLSGTVTVTNTGPTAISIERVTPSGSVVVGSNACSGALQPGTACLIQISVTPGVAGPLTGQISVTAVGSVPGELIAAVTAEGVATTDLPSIDGPASPSSPANPAVPVAPQAAGSDPNDPSLTGVPIGSVPRIAPRVPNSTPSRSTGRTSTTRTSTGRTTTIIDNGNGVDGGSAVPTPTFQPAVFEYAPTISGAGRRVASFELSNVTDVPITVTAVSIAGESADSFVIEATNCQDAPIAAGATCAAEVAFAPSVVGNLSAQLVAQLADGSEVVGALSGVGAPEPTLSVAPTVAAANQVVTAIGGGFPADTVVTLWIGNEMQTQDVETDQVGSFGVTFVVPPHQSSGPMSLGVVARPASFADVSGTLLVSGANGRSNTAVLRSPGGTSSTP
jgi:hypothetical protein